MLTVRVHTSGCIELIIQWQLTKWKWYTFIASLLLLFCWSKLIILICKLEYRHGGGGYTMRLVCDITVITALYATAHPVASEYPHSTHNCTPPCSHIGTALNEIHIAGQEESESCALVTIVHAALLYQILPNLTDTATSSAPLLFPLASSRVQTKSILLIFFFWMTTHHSFNIYQECYESWNVCLVPLQQNSIM